MLFGDLDGCYYAHTVTFDILDAIALKISDNEAAEQLQRARHKLFNLIHEQVKIPA